ncbi:hypothetical protein BDV93DRAFT_511307 [Ceratobasidium sp. AG-I]|nr:hypothetical protein BDV93DRAFT_511307 [Ceratobasidium sp. AG-I]
MYAHIEYVYPRLTSSGRAALNTYLPNPPLASMSYRTNRIQMLGDTEIPELLATVVQEWENGRAHLAKAIKSYVGTTVALQAATASFPLWPLRYPTSALEDELESLSKELLELDRARVALANTRNAQCSPINRMPPELLVYIFQIIVDIAYPLDIYDSVSSTNPAAKLIQVCSRWRQVAVEARSLWSCIVVPYQASRDYERVSISARTQLGRTRGSSIDLFLSFAQTYTLDDSRFRPTINMIKPYVKELRSLVVRLPRSKHIESLLECCVTNGTPGSLSRLEITQNSFPALLFRQPDSKTHERLNQYLRSVRILRLCRVAFDWKCIVFEQLNELSLCHLDAPCCPTLAQLAGVLSASPGLRRLRLKKMTIHDEIEPVIHSPVRLEHLQTLALDKLDDSSSCGVISVLSLGRQSLDLTFKGDFNSSKTLMALRRFASENRIEKFRFTSVPTRQPLQEILESLPGITYLVLDELKLGGPDINTLAHCNSIPPLPPSSPLVQPNPTSPLPKLKTLAFFDCTIFCDEATFKEAISSLSLKCFCLHNCSIEAPTGSQNMSSSVSTRLCGIDATTELGIWLTEHLSGILDVSIECKKRYI